jgi:hypothetical protein
MQRPSRRWSGKSRSGREAAARSPGDARGDRIACALLALALLALVAFHVVRAFDPARDEFEGATLVVTERLDSGLPGPQWVARAPYTVTPYGPGFPLSAALVARLVPGPVGLPAGRLVSVLAGSLTALLIAWVVKRRIGRLAPALAAAILYLAYPGVAFWLHDYRVDALAVLFVVAAYAAPELPWGGLVWSAVLIVAGSLVKQTVALATIPVFAHLVLTGRVRTAFRYLAGVALLGATVWAGLAAVSGGYYYAMGIAGNRRFYFLRQAELAVFDFVRNPVTLAAGFALAAASWLNAAHLWRCRWVLAFVVGGAFGAALSGGEGATVNYFLEPAALAAIVIGIYGGMLVDHTRPRVSAVAFSIFGLGVALVIGALSVRSARNTGAPPDFTLFRNSLSSPAVLVDAQYIAASIRSGLQPVVNDPFFFRIAVRNKAVDLDRLSDDVRSGRVSGLVLDRPLESAEGLRQWPSELEALVRSHFRAAGQVGTANVYRFQRPD